ncbi:MAG: hypothetical protein K6T73_06250 [Candidatus Bathyarchaeota archaeon]|nr:hypothetical protein [Candidatus Bathyarchaeota archaeon]
MSPSEYERVAEVVKMHPSIRLKEIMKITGLPLRELSALRKLMDEGRVRKVNRYYWEER